MITIRSTIEADVSLNIWRCMILYIKELVMQYLAKIANLIAE